MCVRTRTGPRELDAIPLNGECDAETRDRIDERSPEVRSAIADERTEEKEEGRGREAARSTVEGELVSLENRASSRACLDDSVAKFLPVRPQEARSVKAYTAQFG